MIVSNDDKSSDDLPNGNNEENVVAPSKIVGQRLKRLLKPEILNYVQQNRKKSNNMFNGYINFHFGTGTFNQNNLINGHLAVIFVEKHYLNEILEGKKTLEIRKYGFEKWKNKWIGITCKSNLIYGQVFITGSTKYEKNELLEKDLIKQHCIKNAQDQKKFIKSAKALLHAWKIEDFERFPFH